MGKTIKEKLKEFSPERQKKIKDRADELIAEEMTRQQLAEEMTRQQLRDLFKITQKQIHNIEQEYFFRIEQRSDLMESKILAVFPSCEPVSLIGFLKKTF